MRRTRPGSSTTAAPPERSIVSFGAGEEGSVFCSSTIGCRGCASIVSGGGSMVGGAGGRAGDAFADTHGDGVFDPDFLLRRPIFVLLLRVFFCRRFAKLTYTWSHILYHTMTQYVAGDFSFMTDKSDQAALEDIFQAVVATHTWESLHEDPGDGGFMFGAPGLARTILAALKDPDVHSGLSYAWCMREMQVIARLGWDAYVKDVLTARASQLQSEALDE